jgi:uncharacterized protein YjbJ (UPF0337 family)
MDENAGQKNSPAYRLAAELRSALPRCPARMIPKEFNMDREPVKGPADVTKGAIRDTARKVTGDKELQAEVKFDKAQGSAHNDVADMRDVARKAREKSR